VAGENLLTVCRQTEALQQTLTIRPPVVLIASPASQARLLRIPTLKQKLSAAGKPLDVLTVRERLSDPVIRLNGLIRQNACRAGVMIDGENVRDSARILYLQHLAQRWNP